MALQVVMLALAAREKLKTFRDDHSRRSEEVVELWLESIQPNLQKLSDDGAILLFCLLSSKIF